ncbi:hypothetical protein HGM15179_021888 [Zosterops borbonicus]|uniref:Uncharacterized protein n=1 Tax=Zosterops borbonicus TaxID=364589 RepID=A0A8K1FTL7_9PASS|nr:hypothetical protein HGM15179_021888 [Zosterops borbonicus]
MEVQGQVRILLGILWDSHKILEFWRVMTRGTAFSPSYRFTLSDGSVLSAHTKCKLCYPSSPELQPFIMGVHVIDR